MGFIIGIAFIGFGILCFISLLSDSIADKINNKD